MKFSTHLKVSSFNEVVSKYGVTEVAPVKLNRKLQEAQYYRVTHFEDEESIPLYKSKIRDKQFQQMIEALQDVYGKPKNTTAK